MLLNLTDCMACGAVTDWSLISWDRCSGNKKNQFRVGGGMSLEQQPRRATNASKLGSKMPSKLGIERFLGEWSPVESPVLF